MSAPLQGTVSAATSIARVRYTHDAMIDVLIANPAIKQNKIAEHFGVTVPWVSRIFNSDAFQARLAERKADVVDPVLVAGLEEKLRGLMDQSIEVIADKLELSRNPDTALKALELSSKALGYGAKAQNVAVQNTFVVQLPERSPDAASWASKYGPGASADAVEVVGKSVPPHENPKSDLMSLTRAA